MAERGVDNCISIQSSSHCPSRPLGCPNLPIKGKEETRQGTLLLHRHVAVFFLYFIPRFTFSVIFLFVR